jgi:tetratricopeptide (TPR) repeat protein
MRVPFSGDLMPQSASHQCDALSHTIRLPDSPAELSGPVKAWREDLDILTYLPELPDRNPMFLEKRVYQGSSGRVYPLPFIDRIATEPAIKRWQAIHIENEYLRLMILPEIGGRIHVGYDKRTGYDFFYRQNVIKPALVGLAGPWISGGVEFNWPQHHRPATFMPVDTEIEHGSDGSITVWCSDHDPMLRMKGTHGVCLHAGRPVIDLRVRLYNRTPFIQTFLWWANVAVRVHEKYQSFFPPDVCSVADHAKRAVTSFPLSDGLYYGVDYGRRARIGVADDEKPGSFVPDGSNPPNDLSWYSNIPVPTSYMITGTEQDFFGGYDHLAQAGVVHVANHHIAPGKKQWTWGNHEFGYAWDRNLTDNDGPYIELMAGVYTDNQPDFSYLAPWETKSFVQTWYPIQSIGTPVAANTDAALSVQIVGSAVRIGLCVTSNVPDAAIVLSGADGTEIARWTKSLDVSGPLLLEAPLPSGASAANIAVSVSSHVATLIQYDPATIKPCPPAAVAREPKAPKDIESIEELYLTGVHLEQYRHATRAPELYWQEGLRRDPGDSRIHSALGLLHLRRGQFDAAAQHFETAIARLAALNPNPREGEPYYNLGLTRRYQGRDKEAYDAFYKAAWNASWRGPAYFALAECDAARDEWQTATNHLRRSLWADANNLNARDLLGIALEKLGNTAAAEAIFNETLAIDPLDVGARWQKGISPSNGQEFLDLAFDLIRAGQHQRAFDLLGSADCRVRDGSSPMILFTLAFLQEKLGGPNVIETLHAANAAPLDYSFPSRLEEMEILEWAMSSDSTLWSASYLLGNLLYDKRRYQEAIRCWEKAAGLNPTVSTVHRNLGIAYFNVAHDSARSLESYERALQCDPLDARVFFERDQLWKRIGTTPQRRHDELQRHRNLVEARDDLTVEMATLLNQIGKPEDALNVLLGRRFQPWEGGEGLVLGQYVRAQLLLGRRALDADCAASAHSHFLAALRPPDNLSEAKHLLANQSDVYYWIAEALHRDEQDEAARKWWQRAAGAQGDFKQMSVREISDMTFWTGLALRRLENESAATQLFQRINHYSIALEHAEPKIDYFATSLPAMLLFDDDLKRRNRIDALFLRAQACIGLHRGVDAHALLREVLLLDANHGPARDLIEALDNQTEMQSWI